MGRKRLGVTRNCVVCGSEFYKPPSHTAKWPALTCSRTCAARHFRDKGEDRKCAHCGKEFWAHAFSTAKGYSTTCSRACHFAMRQTAVARVCDNCGGGFMSPPNQIASGGGKYCSRGCQFHFRRKLRKRGEQRMFTEWQKREWKGPSCERCGSTELLELDHKVPRFAGGDTMRQNAQTLCRPCNRKKFWTDDYPLYKAHLRLRAEKC